jgi:transcriptional regulator with XRE-family HTH domain
MNDKFIAERVTQLRLTKNKLSEYKLSLELGLSRTYIGMVTRGKTKPSMGVFLAICEYFEITPVQFFAPYLTDKLNSLMMDINELADEDIDCLCRIVEAFLNEKKLKKQDEQTRKG